MEIISNTLVVIVIVGYVLYELTFLIKKTESPFYKGYFSLFAVLHFSISIFFAYNLDFFESVNDPQRYFQVAVSANNWLSLFQLGHNIAAFVVYPLVNLGITLQTLFILFSAISFKGFLVYFELIEVTKFKNLYHVFLLIFFLIPSINLWTGFFGKDALVFLLMALVLKEVNKNVLSYFIITLTLFVFIIRPHVGIVLILSLIINFLFSRNYIAVVKFRISIILTVCLVIIGGLSAYYFLKVNEINVSEITSYFFKLQQYFLKESTTTISSDTNFLLRIVYLLVMPLPFLYPMKNAFILFISIENLYFLIVFIWFLILIAKKRLLKPLITAKNRFSLIVTVLLLLILSSYSFNLGYGNRIRIMFLPYLFYFLSSLNLKSNRHTVVSLRHSN